MTRPCARAGILQPPAFDLAASEAVNYGAIGAVIGHEISHAFDDKGSRHDAGRRLKESRTDEDRRRFLERAECIIARFDGYFIAPGVHHSGKLVPGEAIADLAGLRIAYRAGRNAGEATGAPRRRHPSGGAARDGAAPSSPMW